MRIIDGIHRVEAAALRGDQVIRARLFAGDAEVAFRLAVHANVTHGMPLTLADHTTAAGRILRSRPNLSDRAVACTTGLSPGTVRAIRRRLNPDPAAATGRRGRDGRVRPVNGADGRRRAAVLLSNRPEASLREIARESGISPATVRDVRDRVRRGDNPVPPRQRSPDGTPVRLTGQVDEPAPPTARRDPAQLLHGLRNDPSLRFTEAGRALIAWLNEHVIGVGRWPDLLTRIPPHSTYLLTEIARAARRNGPRSPTNCAATAKRTATGQLRIRTVEQPRSRSGSARLDRGTRRLALRVVPVPQRAAPREDHDDDREHDADEQTDP